jgi:hypothetical protein
MTDLLNVLNGQPPANIKGNSNMPNTLKSHSNPLPEGPVVLTFWPPCLGIALATPGQQKVKKKLLCDRCDSSEAGGGSMSKDS